MKANFFFIVIFFLHFNSYGVRPFITDDARVVGFKLFQWETWLRSDPEGFHSWHMFAYGPHKRIELTMGGALGADLGDNPQLFTGSAPLLQIKILLNEYKPNKFPGVAIATGTFLPFGVGGIKPPGYGNFTFLAITQSFLKNDALLFHGNIGYNYLKIESKNDIKPIWGFGTQAHLYKGFHFVGEIFSGDPYVAGAETAFQVGFRHFASDLLQIDMTIGKGFSGSRPMPLWTTVGVRIVTEHFLKKSFKVKTKHSA